MGDDEKTSINLNFDSKVRREFRGATITSDAGLLACRGLDDALNPTHAADDFLKDSRTGNNIRRKLSHAVAKTVRRRVILDIDSSELPVHGRQFKRLTAHKNKEPQHYPGLLVNLHGQHLNGSISSLPVSLSPTVAQ